MHFLAPRCTLTSNFREDSVCVCVCVCVGEGVEVRGGGGGGGGAGGGAGRMLVLDKFYNLFDFIRHHFFKSSS